METHEIIEQWYRRATTNNGEPSDPFFQFISVWVAFNGLYAARHHSGSGDKNKVLLFAGEPRVVAKHQQLMRDDAEYQNAVHVLKERGVLNLQRRGVREQITDPYNVSEVMTCVYTVRCNLFHGGKSPTGARNQNLVQASYIIVSKLIAPYIGEWV